MLPFSWLTSRSLCERHPSSIEQCGRKNENGGTYGTFIMDCVDPCPLYRDDDWVREDVAIRASYFDTIGSPDPRRRSSASKVRIAACAA